VVVRWNRRVISIRAIPERDSATVVTDRVSGRVHRKVRSAG
jgi:hypothetical protein